MGTHGSTWGGRIEYISRVDLGQVWRQELERSGGGWNVGKSVRGQMSEIGSLGEVVWKPSAMETAWNLRRYPGHLLKQGKPSSGSTGLYSIELLPSGVLWKPLNTSD